MGCGQSKNAIASNEKPSDNISASNNVSTTNNKIETDLHSENGVPINREVIGESNTQQVNSVLVSDNHKVKSVNSVNNTGDIDSKQKVLTHKVEETKYVNSASNAGDIDSKQKELTHKLEETRLSEQVGNGLPSLPEKESKLNTTVSDKIKNESTLTISPRAGFVIKSKYTKTGEKVFINIFYHEAVVESIPCDAQYSTDKKGEECLAYSVVIPARLYQASYAYDSPEINKISTDALRLIDKTYNVTLDPDYKIPKMKRGFVGDKIHDVEITVYKVEPPPPTVTTPIDAKVLLPIVTPVAKEIPVVTPVKEVPVVTPSDTKTGDAHPAANSTCTRVVADVKLTTQQEEERLPPVPAHNAHKESSHASNDSLSLPPLPPPASVALPAVVQNVSEKSTVVDTEVNETAEKLDVTSQKRLESDRIGSSTFSNILPLAVRPVPPKMHGWLKKRGHVVLNWKSRYFVLDNGYLTYYVDKLETPPYGRDMKGQLCLAGYREKEFSESSKSGKRGSAAVVDAALWLNRIHLVYDSTLFESDESDIKDSDDQFQDLLLEAASSDEKSAWLAAIQAHTEYFESTLQVAASPLLLQQHSHSPSPINDDTDTANDDASESTETIQQQSAAPMKRASTMSVSGTKRSLSMAPSRQSTYSVVDDKKRWAIFLHTGEDLVMTGLTGKPNPVGIHLIRQLILTSRKRLLYIDTKTLELKGEIEWTSDANAAYPQAKKIDEITFDVVQSAKRTYRFVCKDGCTAAMWVTAISNTAPPPPAHNKWQS